MPFDENGREYKECQYQYCVKNRFYRDEEPYRTMNTHNWNKKKFCCAQHKRDAHNQYRLNTNPLALTTGAGRKRKKK
jgi:hypothetical protein